MSTEAWILLALLLSIAGFFLFYIQPDKNDEVSDSLENLAKECDYRYRILASGTDGFNVQRQWKGTFRPGEWDTVKEKGALFKLGILFSDSREAEEFIEKEIRKEVSATRKRHRRVLEEQAHREKNPTRNYP